MQLLTPHFEDTELGVEDEPLLSSILINAVQLCDTLLEPIRAQYGPVTLSCGYRDPASNHAVGGASNSQHLYIGQNSAADIVSCGTTPLTEVFEWIRLESHLDFDQAILEVSPKTQQPACIHISYNGALTQQRRMALTGETNGAGAYSAVQVNP